jgi:acyl-CoA thioesterase FadM
VAGEPLEGFPIRVEIPVAWVVSRRHDRVAADGSGRIVSYDYENKCRAPIPPELRERLARLEAGA